MTGGVDKTHTVEKWVKIGSHLRKLRTFKPLRKDKSLNGNNSYQSTSNCFLSGFRCIVMSAASLFAATTFLYMDL